MTEEMVGTIQMRIQCIIWKFKVKMIKLLLKLFLYPAAICAAFIVVLYFLKLIWCFGIWDIQPLLNPPVNLFWLRLVYITTFIFNLGLRIDEKI